MYQVRISLIMGKVVMVGVVGRGINIVRITRANAQCQRVVAQIFRIKVTFSLISHQ